MFARTAGRTTAVARPVPRSIAISVQPPPVVSPLEAAQMLIHSGIQAGIQVGIEAGIQAGIQAGVDAGTRTVKAAARRIAHASSIGFSAILPVRPTAPRPTEKRATQKSSTFSNASRPAVSPSNYANSDTHTTGRIAREARSDEQLVVAHRAGDSSALRALIERYQGELHGFLTRLVGSRAGADDVFQEAFLQVHLSADSFDEERRFKPWLYTIAANKGRDFLRRQKRRQAMSLDAPVGASGEAALVDLLDGPDQAPASSLESSDEASIVKGVVDELPSHFREILLLAYFQKMSYAQISDSLSIPLGTVKSRLHAAVASFAESWRLACARRGLPSNATPLPAKLRGKDDDSTR